MITLDGLMLQIGNLDNENLKNLVLNQNEKAVDRKNILNECLISMGLSI